MATRKTKTEETQDDTAVERDRNLHRHGDPDPKQWDKQPVFADRAQRDPLPNTTFADRAKERAKAEKKQQTTAENKAVSDADAKD